MPGFFRSRIPFHVVVLAVIFAAALLTVAAAQAQRLPGTENGEWRYLGGDAGHTRSSSLDQINGSNFSDLEVAWIWRGDNFGPNLDYFNRATPIHVDGVLYTVASPRRPGGGHRSGDRRERSGRSARRRPSAISARPGRRTARGWPTRR